MGSSMHLSNIFKRKVDGYTMLTLALNDLNFLKKMELNRFSKMKVDI